MNRNEIHRIRHDAELAIAGGSTGAPRARQKIAYENGEAAEVKMKSRWKSTAEWVLHGNAGRRALPAVVELQRLDEVAPPALDPRAKVDLLGAADHFQALAGGVLC